MMPVKLESLSPAVNFTSANVVFKWARFANLNPTTSRPVVLPERSRLSVKPSAKSTALDLSASMPLDAVPFKRVLSVLNVKAEVVPPFARMITPSPSRRSISFPPLNAMSEAPVKPVSTTEAWSFVVLLLIKRSSASGAIVIVTPDPTIVLLSEVIVSLLAKFRSEFISMSLLWPANATPSKTKLRANTKAVNLPYFIYSPLIKYLNKSLWIWREIINFVSKFKNLNYERKASAAAQAQPSAQFFLGFLKTKIHFRANWLYRYEISLSRKTNTSRNTKRKHHRLLVNTSKSTPWSTSPLTIRRIFCHQRYRIHQRNEYTIISHLGILLWFDKQVPKNLTNQCTINKYSVPKYFLWKRA